LPRREQAGANQGREPALNRSLRELKFCFLAALPLLCAGRALERANLFLIEPIAAQKAVFGRTVAYPWQLEKADSRFGEDGVATTWRYKLPAFPSPVKQCEAKDWLQPRHPSSGERACGMDWAGGYLKAGWEKGRLWMAFDPPHEDRSISGADNR